MIKTVLLLSALICCWQSSALDMEQVKEERRSVKRSAQQAEVFESEKEGSFKVLTNDIIRYILQYFDLAKDQNTLLPLSASCKRFNGIIQQRYSDANKAERHYPWQDSPSLNSSMVYTLNTRLRTILGLYNNIKHYSKISFHANNTEIVDRIRFENLCSQFVKAPLFPATAVPVMYVETLQLDLSSSKPSPFQASPANALQRALNKKKLTLEPKLYSIQSQQNSKLQNETALCFHYLQFVLKTPPAELVNLQNTPLFRQLDGSLMKVMDQELLSLKATLGLSHSANFSKTWKRIIDLEPAPTTFQLDVAAYSYLETTRVSADPLVMFANFTKCAKYREERLKAIKVAGQSPTELDYADIAYIYSCVGGHATNSQVMFENFTKSAEYHEEEFKAIKAAGTSPTVCQYGNIGEAYFRVGDNAMDHRVKLESYKKSAEYFEEQLKVIKAVGQSSTEDDYAYAIIASAYFGVGENATDPQVKLANYTRAKAYFEISLKVGLDEEDAQMALECLVQISTYLGDFEKAAHHENFGKKN